MKRTTIMLPVELKDKAQRHADSKGISMGKLIRDALVSVLRSEGPERSRDFLFAEKAIYDGPAPADGSKNHDRYIYDTGK